MAVLEFVASGFLVGQYIYHRWGLEPDKPKPIREFEIPRVDEGAVYPLVYGRCRVRAPILAYAGTPSARPVDPAENAYIGFPYEFAYGLDMFFQIGIGFEGGGANTLHAVYASDMLLTPQPASVLDPDLVPPASLTGAGGYERASRCCFLTTRTVASGPLTNDGVWIEGELEFLNGGPNQQTADGAPAYGWTTLAGERMEDAGIGGALQPGYRGHMCAFLTKFPIDKVTTLGDPADFVDGFLVGGSPSVPNFSFEVASYRSSSISTSPGATSLVNSGHGLVESNPADALYDLLTGRLGKLGIPAAYVDLVSFGAAADTLSDEGHGFSRAYEDQSEGSEIIQEILRQIDGVIYWDPEALKIKIKLVRGDYDPQAVPLIEPGVCDRLENVALGGWTNVVNKVRVVFNDRLLGYQDNSATAHNSANAVGQDGQVREVILQMKGVCTSDLAETIAARELSARSRPITRCRAIVDRSFRLVMPGDVVGVTWPEYGWDGRLFRVAGVDRGSLAKGEIALDLIEDFFYQRRGSLTNTGGTIGAFPVTVDPILEPEA